MEIFVAVIISLGIGIYAARNAETELPKLSEDQHKNHMLQCRVMCGKERVRSYDVLTGECMCIERSN